MPTTDPIDRIIRQIRDLDLESKRIINKRIELVHKLETAVEVVAAIEREEPLDKIIFRFGERIEILNKVTASRYSGVVSEDKRGTVIKQKKTDHGDIKVFFRTDSGVNTHRFARNIRRLTPDNPYEIARRAQSKQSNIADQNTKQE